MADSAVGVGHVLQEKAAAMLPMAFGTGYVLRPGDMVWAAPLG